MVTSVLPTYPSSTFPTQTRTLSAAPNRVLGIIKQDLLDGQDGKQNRVSVHLVPGFKELRRFDQERGNLVGLSWLKLSPFSPVASENGGGVSDGGGGDGDGGMSGFKDKDDGG